MSCTIPRRATRISQKALSGNVKISFGFLSGETLKPLSEWKPPPTSKQTNKRKRSPRRDEGMLGTAWRSQSAPAKSTSWVSACRKPDHLTVSRTAATPQTQGSSGAKVAATGLPRIWVPRREAVNQGKVFSAMQSCSLKWVSSHFQKGKGNAEPQTARHLR